MNKFDASFISSIKVNDLTEEEVNNLRIQRTEIDNIINSYETNKTDMQRVKNELYVGKYFKEQYGNYITYYKILSANPFYYLKFTLCKNNSVSNIIHHKEDDNDFEYFMFEDDFFDIDEEWGFYFNDMIEITEEEFGIAMDRKYQEFKQELSNIPDNNEKN
mgnify:CR=1 FL=1